MSRIIVCIALAFSFCFNPCAQAATVAVDNREFVVADSAARVVDSIFGGKELEVWFFKDKLDPDKKATALLERYPTASSLQKSLGQAPIMALAFFFKAGSKGCSTSDFLSYTAVFEKSSALPLESDVTAPINFSFSGKSYSEVGIDQLAGSFSPGSLITLKLKGSWQADRQMFPTLLRPGKASMLFSWNLDLQTSLIDPTAALKESEAKSGREILKNSSYQDAVALLGTKDKQLVLLFYKNKLSQPELKEIIEGKRLRPAWAVTFHFRDLQSNPNARNFKSYYYVSRFLESAPNQVTSATGELQNDISAGKLPVSGELVIGKQLQLQIKGFSPALPGSPTPSIEWDLQTSVPLQAIQEKINF